MAARKCERKGCSNPPKSERAKFCAAVECERARARARRRTADQKQRTRATETLDEGAVGGDSLRPGGGVFAATLEELTAGGRVHTAAGQQALKLATRIDYSGEDTGSSVAALGRQHLATLAEALKGAGATADPVDEFTERRRARESA